MGNFPVILLMLMSKVIEGDRIWAASLMILGPNRPIPVAFEESSLLMNDNTWPHVISGTRKKVFSGSW